MSVRRIRRPAPDGVSGTFRIIVPHHPRDPSVRVNLDGIALAVYPRRGVAYYGPEDVFEVLRAFNQRWLNVRLWPPAGMEPWAESSDIPRPNGHYLNPFITPPADRILLEPYARHLVSSKLEELDLDYRETLLLHESEWPELGDDIRSYMSTLALELTGGLLDDPFDFDPYEDKQ